MNERGKNEPTMDLCSPPANPAATNCLPDWCFKCPPLLTRKACGKVPRFHIPECLPRVIKEPCKPLVILGFYRLRKRDAFRSAFREIRSNLDILGHVGLLEFTLRALIDDTKTMITVFFFFFFLSVLIQYVGAHGLPQSTRAPSCLL